MQLFMLILLPVASLLPPGTQTAGQESEAQYKGGYHRPAPRQRDCKARDFVQRGRTSPESESTPTKLQEVDVVVMKDAKCPRKRNGTYQYYKASTMMCVGDPKTNKNCAKGDSGGPLVCGKTAQGIVSWGSEDETPPAVYTRVSTFIPWIQETMKRLQP